MPLWQVLLTAQCNKEQIRILADLLLLIVEERAHTNIVHRSLYISCFLCYS
jgi:hypothetical protein